MIACQCPHCTTLLQIAPANAGKPVACPYCRRAFVASALASPRTGSACRPCEARPDEDVYTDLVPVDEELTDEEVIDLEPVEDDPEPAKLEPPGEGDFFLGGDDD